MLIAYDAGHFLETPGKRTPDGEREWGFNNLVALGFEKQMNKYKGVKLLRTDDRSGKKDVSLTTRTNAANNAGADIYLSFHHNAHEGVWDDHTGSETYHALGSVEGMALARAVQKALVKAYGLRDRGLKTANLHITRETKMPAALAEGGFMDSTIDIKKMRDPKVLDIAGVEVAKAVADLYGLVEGGTNNTPVTKPSTPKSESNKGIDTLAREVIAGKHGSGAERKQSLGVRYNDVQKRVNDILLGGTTKKRPAKGIETLAREVIAGKHGTGDKRKQSLGNQYNAVQKRVNELSGVGNKKPAGKSIATLVKEVNQGKHGHGVARKKSLGKDYDRVQAEINKMYK